MKRGFPFFATLLLTLSLVGCRAHHQAQVSAGHLDNYTDFQSQYVPARTIHVWTPSDYDPAQRYEVLYMHDGKMLFDKNVTWNHQEWGVDEAMDSLIRSGAIRPTIVVGIDNNDNRISEYCPDDLAELLEPGHPVYQGLEAKGNDYLRFVVEEVKPFIDATYSTYPDRDHTWVMGSSCGGLISSYALCKYPDVFGGAICMSTHCTLAFPNPSNPDEEVLTAYREYLRMHLAPNCYKIYMDQGDQTLDAFYGEAQRQINEMFAAQGWDDAHFMYRYFPGHAHCEDDWQSRLDIPLTFLLSK